MNFTKPGWIVWGNCSKCGRRFDTRHHTRALCPDCNRVISPRITRRESLELELRNYLSFYDEIHQEIKVARGRTFNLYYFLNFIMRTNLNYNSILSEYSYYYPYC